MVVAGAGTAFAFIPISIAALAGVKEQQAGLASGLLNTSQQLGGAIGVAVASTIAATRFATLAHAGSATPVALTGGFQWALWVCGAVRIAGVPVALLLVKDRAVTSAAIVRSDTEPALASAE